MLNHLSLNRAYSKSSIVVGCRVKICFLFFVYKYSIYRGSKQAFNILSLNELFGKEVFSPPVPSICWEMGKDLDLYFLCISLYRRYKQAFIILGLKELVGKFRYSFARFYNVLNMYNVYIFADGREQDFDHILLTNESLRSPVNQISYRPMESVNQ